MKKMNLPIKKKAQKRNKSGEEDSIPLAKRKKETNGGNLPAKKETTILSLVDELLTQIINMVPIAQWPGLESFSRRFQQAVFGAWRELRDINICDDLLIRAGALDQILEKLFLRAKYIPSIGKFCDILADNSFRLLAQFAHLESINFDGVSMRKIDLADFLETSVSRTQLKVI